MNLNHWTGTLPEGSDIGTKPRIPVVKFKPAETLNHIARTGKGEKLPDETVLGIFACKGKMKAQECADKYQVHPSTVNSIWRKAVRRALLEYAGVIA